MITGRYYSRFPKESIPLSIAPDNNTQHVVVIKIDAVPSDVAKIDSMFKATCTR
jgi:hypothetical protein